MFLNVDMMLLPPRGYRQGCHRSPLRTALPIVIGIVPGSHRYISYCLFWTFFNGPFLRILWPSLIRPSLNSNVSIIGSRRWCYSRRHDFLRPDTAHDDLDVSLLAVRSPESPYMFDDRKGGGLPISLLVHLYKGG